MSSSAGTDDGYDSDEPPQLELDIGELLSRATDALRTHCTGAKRLARGASHEIFVLSFEQNEATHETLAKSDHLCIARFTRVKSEAAVARDISEIATLQYLKKHTKVPVPDIYFQDLTLENNVGAPYVLMQHLPGRHLYKIWPRLSLDHKKAALSQIASIVIQFASLRFDSIGCLQNHGIGPIISPSSNRSKGPFSTTKEYLESFISTDHAKSPELMELFRNIQKELDNFLTHNRTASYLQPPFSIIHADFDGQNLLFIEQPNGLPPKLSAVIDFEYSYAGPLYFLYEYPIFIQDVSWHKEFYAENRILRSHFVREMYEGLPDATSRAVFITCMNGKSFALNSFQMFFMNMECSEDTLVGLAQSYLKDLKEGNQPAYSGRLDYTPELYLETGELMPLNS